MRIIAVRETALPQRLSISHIDTFKWPKEGRVVGRVSPVVQRFAHITVEQGVVEFVLTIPYVILRLQTAATDWHFEGRSPRR